MITPDTYFEEHGLYDLRRLKEHAENNLVKVITSPRFPGVVMLHYSEEAQWEKSWNSFNRMCRGLIVDMVNHKILAYPYSKFFNLGEMPETSYNNLKDQKDFEVSEKLDGSMLIRFKDPNTGEYHFTTKGSLDSEHGIYATSIMPPQLKNPEFDDYTLIFELISKRFQNVINYQKKGYSEGVYLVGVRQHWTYKLFTYDEVQSMAEDWLYLSTIKTYEFESLDKLIETAKELPVLEEGYVLRFQDGLLVKIKGTAYLRAHRFISRLSDKNLLEAVAEGIDKEVIEIAPEEYKEDVCQKVAYFQNRCQQMIDDCHGYFTEAPKEDRKNYAFWVNGHVQPCFRSFMFNLLDNKSIDKKKMYKILGEIEKVSGETRI